jgi:hypothetical protein
MHIMRKKKCKDCGRNKTIDEYYKSKYNKDLLNNICKVCYRKKVKAREDRLAEMPEIDDSTLTNIELKELIKLCGRDFLIESHHRMAVDNPEDTEFHQERIDRIKSF